MKDWPWRSNPNFYSVWCYLLEEASGIEKPDLFDGRKVVLIPGQFITGRKKIAKVTGIHQSSVQRILSRLEIEHQIEQQTGAKSRLITIVKWDEYHSGEQQTEQQVNNKRTTTEQQLNTVVEVKEVKKGEKVKKTYPDDFLLFWKAYPLKKSKGQALRAWKATNGNRPPLDELLLIIEEQKTWPEFQEFTKHGATWLNAHGWEDEKKESKEAQKPMSYAEKILRDGGYYDDA